MNENKKINSKNSLEKYLTPTSKKSRNILINTNNFINNDKPLIISKDLSKKNKTLKISPKSNRIFKKIKISINTNPHKNINDERIYLRLKEKDKIEKIIKEAYHQTIKDNIHL